jgi:Resolvase, N terminal domain
MPRLYPGRRAQPRQAKFVTVPGRSPATFPASTGGPTAAARSTSDHAAGARARARRQGAPARCPKPSVSATTATPPPQRVRQASKTRVRNQCRTTSVVTGFCDGQRHGTSAWLCSRLHHRPAATPPGRRPGAGRLLSGVHRDGQRRPCRPRRRVPQPPGGDRHHHSGGKLVFHVFAALAEFERDLIRERTSAGLAAARARGRRGGRPSVMTVHKLQVAQQMYRSGQDSVAAIATTLGVSRASVDRHLTGDSR